MNEENSAVQETNESAESQETQETQETTEVEETLVGGKETKEAEGSQEDNKGDTEGEEKGEVPESYDIKAPEGMTLDLEMLESFTPVFKELGLTNEQTQKLVDVYAPHMQQTAEKQQEEALKQFKKTVEGWKADTIKELGNDKDKKLAFAAKARNKFGDESFLEMVNDLGVGNHPSMVRFLIKVGKTISEDAFVDGKGSGKSSSLKKMYPTMNK